MNSEEQAMNSNEQVVNQLATASAFPYASLALAGAAVVGAGFYYYMNKASGQVKQLYNYEQQTREIAGRDDHARINIVNKTDKLMSCYYDDVTTMYELYMHGEKVSNNGHYLGWKPTPTEPYKWMTYGEANETARDLGSALLNFGLEPATETFVGIFAKNRPEWVLTDMACQFYSLVSVPLYDTLGLEAISFILLQTQMKVVVCDDSEKAIHLMNSKSNLEHIIVFDVISDECKSRASEMNIKLMTFEDAKKQGKLNKKSPVPPKPKDLTTICYTSGTTGLPKGALITHENIIAIASSMLVYLQNKDIKLDEKQRYLSYLPLAHMFERVSQASIVSLGGAIGFYQGDIKKLIDDMKEVKPTVFCTVPRLLNRIYSKIMNNLEHSPAYKKQIFKFAFAQKEKEVLRGIIRNDGIYDLAFKQVRESLGGCVKFIITGSAPIAPEVLHFMRVVSGCYVMEGYGATETGGACGIQLPGATAIGSVGPPFPCSMYKLADVPEMDLDAQRDNKGEILIAGPNIFKGYFKDEEKTKAALTDDGWYKSGDIGTFDKSGCLRIVDRVKNIFKLQQGEYIAPEKIENIYVRSKYVAQVFVYGCSFKSVLISIVVPEETVIYEWAREHNLEQNMVTLCKNKDLEKVIIDDMNIIGKQSGLKGFEMTKKIHLHDDLFSIENDMLTPTMKAKRNVLQKVFQSQLDEMYSNLE